MQYINYATETIVPITSFHNKGKEVLIVNPQNLLQITERIYRDENCKYPQLTMRILVHIFVDIDTNNRWSASARNLSKKFGVHYDTITKSLKYLRTIDVIKTTEKKPTIH